MKRRETKHIEHLLVVVEVLRRERDAQLERSEGGKEGERTDVDALAAFAADRVRLVVRQAGVPLRVGVPEK